MKVIKDFVDMMDNMAMTGFKSYFTQTKEYQALKAAADQPIPKMEITDEMVNGVMSYLRNCNPQLDYRAAIKAALEAVFDHISDKGKKVELINYKEAQQAENRRLTDIMEKLALNPKPTVFARLNVGEEITLEENQLHLEKELIREMIKPKKKTLLQWISNQNCGKPSPLTERE